MEENDLILGPADLIPSHSLFYFESSFVSDMLPVSVVLATKAVCHESVGLVDGTEGKPRSHSGQDHL